MRYTVTLPLNYNSGEAIPASALNQYENAILDLVGGATITEARGVWRDNGVTYRDRVEVVETYTDADILPELIGIARAACRWLMQQAIFVTAGDETFLVTADVPTVTDELDERREQLERLGR